MDLDQQSLAVIIGVGAGSAILIPLIFGIWFMWLIYGLNVQLRRIADVAEEVTTIAQRISHSQIKSIKVLGDIAENIDAVKAALESRHLLEKINISKQSSENKEAQGEREGPEDGQISLPV